MAIYEDILGAIDNYKPGQEQGGAGSQNSISLKITPITPPTPAAGAGTGGGGAGMPTLQPQSTQQLGTPTGTNTPLGGSTPGGGSILNPQQQLTRNPQLVQHPLGAFTDPEYEAAIAGEKYNFDVQYLNVLKQLGFLSDTGQFIPGTVEQNAARERAQLQYGTEEAARETTEAAVQGGTVFSGRRADNQARAQHPFIAALAELEAQIPGQLADLYDQANSLITQFEISQNQLLAQASARAAANIRANPVGATQPAAAPSGSEGGGTPPPAPPPPEANPLMNLLIQRGYDPAYIRTLSQTQRQELVNMNVGPMGLVR